MGEAELAFRAQLVIPEQKALYDYWCNRSGSGAMPGRGDISPAGFPALLPTISLIDVEYPAKRYKVRLAGTGLRDIYTHELTGRYLGEFYMGCKSDYWLSVCHRLVERKRPAQGAVQTGFKSREQMVQFWLRLPLSCDGKQVNMILCYDVFLSVQKARHLTRQKLAS